MNVIRQGDITGFDDAEVVDGDEDDGELIIDLDEDNY